eukprot:s5984_g1.t1
MEKLSKFGVFGTVNQSLLASLTDQQAAELRSAIGRRGLTSIEASVLQDAKDKMRRAKSLGYEGVEDRYASDAQFCDRVHQEGKGADSKKDKGIDVIQVGSIASAAFLVLWIIASTMVSAVFTVRYMGIVEEDQAWYLLEGSARTAAAEAKAVMDTAMQAKSDLIAAIDHGLIKTSYDYAAIESTLVPTMALKPYVHSFEMIFTDRNAGLKISHREEE